MGVQSQICVFHKQDLYDNIGYGHGRIATVSGDVELGDSDLYFYMYDENSTAEDDGYNVIKPTQVDEIEHFGRFLKKKIKQSAINIKRTETYSGTTDANGAYSVVFPNSFTSIPNIQANIIGGSNTNSIKTTSVSTTGFTVNVVNRVEVLGLLPSYANVNGATVDVLITEK